MRVTWKTFLARLLLCLWQRLWQPYPGARTGICGLKKRTAVQLVALLCAYVQMDLSHSPKINDSIQNCHAGRTVAEHFLSALHTLEATAGQRWARRVSLSGNIEVDATALGKFWVGQANKRFSDDIHRLTAKAKRLRIPIPNSSVFWIHEAWWSGSQPRADCTWTMSDFYVRWIYEWWKCLKSYWNNI